MEKYSFNCGPARPPPRCMVSEWRLRAPELLKPFPTMRLRGTAVNVFVSTCCGGPVIPQDKTQPAYLFPSSASAAGAPGQSSTG